MLTVLPLASVNKSCQHVICVLVATKLTMLPRVATMLTILPVCCLCCQYVDCVATMLLAPCCHYPNCDVTPAQVSTQLRQLPASLGTSVPASGRGDPGPVATGHHTPHGDTRNHCPRGTESSSRNRSKLGYSLKIIFSEVKCV